MEERLKQRLVGAVVLVSLAVVFVPILFDMPGEPNGEPSADLISGIPERPQVEFGSSASGTLDAPQTPRLDTELDRESSRNASRAGAGERIVSSEVLVSGTTSSAPGTPAPARTGERTVSSEVPVAGTTSISSGASGSAQVADVSEPPVSQARSETSVARADPAPAKKQAKQGSSTKPVAAVSAGGGWTVQLGSFLKSENAAALRKRLQARGYTAFVESGTSARGAVSRVFVGPMPDREQAKASAARLQREMALEGIVVPYRGG